MLFLLDELYNLLKRDFNPFLEERGLPPLRRVALDPLSSDIFPSLNITLKEISIAREFSSPKEKVWRGVFYLSLLLREDGEGDTPLLGSYIEALWEFLEKRETPPIFRGSCLRISPLPLKKPLQRGISIEYEVLYLP